MAIALLVQRLSPHSRADGSARVNAGLWLVNIAVLGSLCGACVCSAAQWAAAHGVGVFNITSVPTWVAVPISVMFLDLVSYGWHRANHVVPFLWRWHQVHHSDLSFTVSTSLRFHPGELVLSLPLRLLAAVLVGVPVFAVVVFEIAFTLANAIEHGDINLPRSFENVARRIFVTPALHRWHHTAVLPGQHRNFATIFSLWDKLFGSYGANDPRTRVRTGLPGLPEVGLRDALLLPLRSPQA